MRKIEQTTAFKRDIKRESKGVYREALQTELIEVVGRLAQDEPLDERHCDHALMGDWKDFRDCHVKPDLILIYKKIDEQKISKKKSAKQKTGIQKGDEPKTGVEGILQLVRIGSHSELGL